MSTELALQWPSNDARHWQIQGCEETGRNNTLQYTEKCFPSGQSTSLHNAIADFPRSSDRIATAASGLTCNGRHDHEPYAYGQVAMVIELSSRLRVGSLVDANVTLGRDRQFAGLAFVRYMLEPRSAVFSRDLPNNTRDFHLQLDDVHN